MIEHGPPGMKIKRKESHYFIQVVYISACKKDDKKDKKGEKK